MPDGRAPRKRASTDRPGHKKETAMSYDVNSLEAHWMPFSANRDFKANPRMVVKSEGMYMWDYKGGQIIDGSSALFCTPAGHGRREIAGLSTARC